MVTVCCRSTATTDRPRSPRPLPYRPFGPNQPLPPFLNSLLHHNCSQYKADVEREEAKKAQERQQQQQGGAGQGQGAAGAGGSTHLELAASAAAAQDHEAYRELEDVNAWGTPWDPQPRSEGAADGVKRGQAPGVKEEAARVLRMGADCGDLHSALRLVKAQHQLLVLSRYVCVGALERLSAALGNIQAQLAGQLTGSGEHEEEVQVLLTELDNIDSRLALMGAEGQAGGQADVQDAAGATRSELDTRRELLGQLLRLRHGEAAQHGRLDAAVAQQRVARQEVNHTRDELVKVLDGLAVSATVCRAHLMTRCRPHAPGSTPATDARLQGGSPD